MATVKQLFARSGNRCAFPSCTEQLVSGTTVVGEICHISAQSPGGPRYDEAQTVEQRHSADNLVLLCPMHHKTVDDDPGMYPVDRLKDMKLTHETAAESCPPLTDDQAAKFLLRVDNPIAQHGSVLISPGQVGGQIAHSITNVYGQVSAAPAELQPATRVHFVGARMLDDGSPKTLIGLAIKVQVLNGGPSPAMNVRAIFVHPWLFVQPIRDGERPVLTASYDPTELYAGIAVGLTPAITAKAHRGLPPVELDLRVEYRDQNGRWWAEVTPARLEYRFAEQRAWPDDKLRVLGGRARLEGPLAQPTIEFEGWWAENGSAVRASVLLEEVLPRAKSLLALLPEEDNSLCETDPELIADCLESELPRLWIIAEPRAGDDDARALARDLLRRALSRFDDLSER